MFYHALTGNGRTENLEPVLLWENSSPTTPFAAQTVSLDLTDYAGVIVNFYDRHSRVYVKKDDTVNAAGYNTTDTTYAKDISINDNEVRIGNTYVFGSNGESNNSVLIPYKIYGVKEYIVESSTQYTDLEVFSITENAGGATTGSLNITCNIDDLFLLYLTPQGPGDNTYNITIAGADLLDEYNTDINSGSGIYHRKTCLYKATSKNVQGTITATITSLMTGFKIS